jgi:hypothetical protein
MALFRPEEYVGLNIQSQKNMSTFNDPTRGKTIVRGKGTGEITADEIEQRAREIARINGRGEDDVYSEDREQARAELAGEDLPDTSVEDQESIGTLSRDPSNPPAIRGRSATTNEGPDEEKALEKMVLDGVEEAQHDQMVEASRRRET